jgi:hypothetical protein
MYILQIAKILSYDKTVYVSTKPVKIDFLLFCTRKE